MVGIPSGRLSPFSFGIYTLRTAHGLYVLAHSSLCSFSTNSIRAFSVAKSLLVIPSTPAVFAPSFSKTLSSATSIRRLVRMRLYKRLNVGLFRLRCASTSWVRLTHCFRLSLRVLHETCLFSLGVVLMATTSLPFGQEVYSQERVLWLPSFAL